MATTAWKTTGKTWSQSGLNFYLQTRTSVDSFSRSNNTITATGFRVDVRMLSSNGGTWLSGPSITASGTMPGGVTRRDKVTVRSAGSTINSGTVYSTPKVNFTFTEGNTDTETYTNNGAGFNADEGWGSGGQSLAIPGVGAPTGLTASSSNVQATSATISASVSGWGTNATAGTGQRLEYRVSGSGSWTNLAYSTATSHSRDITGLTPAIAYEVRSYAVNGAGRATVSGTHTFTTLPVSGMLPVLMGLLS